MRCHNHVYNYSFRVRQTLILDHDFNCPLQQTVKLEFHPGNLACGRVGVPTPSHFFVVTWQIIIIYMAKQLPQHSLNII